MNIKNFTEKIRNIFLNIITFTAAVFWHCFEHAKKFFVSAYDKLVAYLARLSQGKIIMASLLGALTFILVTAAVILTVILFPTKAKVKEVDSQKPQSDAGGYITVCIGGTLNCTGESFADTLQPLKDVFNGDINIAFLGNGSNTNAENLAAIKSCGINTLSVATRGCAENAEQIAAVAAEAGIKTVGSKENDCLLYETGGIKLGIAAAYGFVTENSTAANYDCTSAVTDDTVTAQIAALKKQGAQYILVLTDWGYAQNTEPTEQQSDLAAAWLKAGADIVCGTNSGCIQTVRKQPDGEGDDYVLYSLGMLKGDEKSAAVASGSFVLCVNIARSANSKITYVAGAQYTPVFRYSDSGAYRVLPVNAKYSASAQNTLSNTRFLNYTAFTSTVYDTIGDLLTPPSSQNEVNSTDALL